MLVPCQRDPSTFASGLTYINTTNIVIDNLQSRSVLVDGLSLPFDNDFAPKISPRLYCTIVNILLLIFTFNTTGTSSHPNRPGGFVNQFPVPFLKRPRIITGESDEKKPVALLAQTCSIA